MSDEVPQPDWRLLPRDPQGFFGFADEFDRKDLKRSYNRWIRLFKPETHPAEFQRIRAAYEELDRELRYGGVADALRSGGAAFDSAAWFPLQQGQRPQTPAAGDGAAERMRPVQVEPELWERVTTESPVALYAELQKTPEKTPFDYYALAILSDVCDRKDGLQFARWLLTGIQKSPRDYALQRLLQAYFRGPLPPGALPGLLVAAAKAIGRDAFFPLTEPGWDVLLRTESLDLFVSTLRKCEPHLRDASLAGRMIFTIRALRTAPWKAAAASPAAAAWTGEALEFIESNFEHIPPASEFEVDLLGMVQAYVKLRREFAATGELQARLDRALEIYFTQDQVAGDRAIVHEQVELAADAANLIDAFPPCAQEPAVKAFYPVWAMVSEEVAERCGSGDVPTIDRQMWSGRAMALLQQLEAKTDGSSLGQIWNWSGIMLRVGQGLCWILPSVFVGIAGVALYEDATRSAWGKTVFWTAMAIGAACIVGGIWLAKKLPEKIFYPYCRRMATGCYRSLWRRDVFDLLARSRLPYWVLRDLVAQNASQRLTTSVWVSDHVSQDYALAVYALALRHVV